MEWFNILMARLRALFRRESVLHDIEEELRIHVEMETERNIERGMPPDEAQAAARKSFGQLSRNTELSYDIRGGGWLETLWQDLRYGTRMLRKQPGFSLITVLTLALGIGANTAIFSVVKAVLLNPLPYHEPDRLVTLSEAHASAGEMGISWPNYQDWQRRAHSFTEMAASRPITLNLTGVEQPLRLSGRAVTWNFFRVLGVQPQLGRDFTSEDDKVGSMPTIILSDSIWKRSFGATPQVLGRTLNLSGTAYTVVGVLPSGFEFSAQEDVYAALGGWLKPYPAWYARDSHPALRAVARLKPGNTLTVAQAEMTQIAAQLEREYPTSNSRQTAVVKGLQANLVGEVRPVLLVLLGAVGFVLLLACVNVANLLLARAPARQQELAVRLALGARRGRLLRQLLTESLLLALLGGAAGVLLGVWLLKGLLSLAPSDLPRLATVQLDGGVLLFTAGITLATGLLFGLLPAWHAMRTELHGMLKEAGRAVGVSGARQRMLNTLLVVEVSLALLLMTGAGLMARTMYRVLQVEPGFRPDHLLTLRFDLAGPQYSDLARRQSFYNEVITRLENTPGIEAAAFTRALPIAGSEEGNLFTVADQASPDRTHQPQGPITAISSGYFQTLGIRLLQGRAFTEADRTNAPSVIIVNETLALRFWPNQNPIGKRLKLGWPESPTPWCEVVGVVADVKQNGFTAPTLPQAYFPLAQLPRSQLYLVVSTKTEPAVQTAAVRAVVRAVEPELPLYQIRTMEEVFNRALLTQRAALGLLGSFAALALVLAVIGIYGVMSYAVAQRTHEIGLRAALGARPRDLLKLILAKGMKLALAGIGCGLVAAGALTRLIKTLLFGVSAIDPLTYIVITLLLAFFALLACWIPARRATKVDPLVALKYE
jgi:putative ABC transport system permease protein